MTQSVAYAIHTPPVPAKVSRKSAPGTCGSISIRQTATGAITSVPSSPVRAEAIGAQPDIGYPNESSRFGRVGLAVRNMCAIEVEASVKARMLRKLAAWYRTLAARAANPVIWESRLVTAEALDAEAGRIEQSAGIRQPSL